VGIKAGGFPPAYEVFSWLPKILFYSGLFGMLLSLIALIATLLKHNDQEQA